jgi:hypothetical protein
MTGGSWDIRSRVRLSLASRSPGELSVPVCEVVERSQEETGVCSKAMTRFGQSPRMN